jgi:hypothetical protein
MLQATILPVFVLTKIHNFYSYGWMVKKIIVYVVIIVCLAGCSYSVYSNAYPHLKRIQLLAFDNKSNEFILGDIVINSLSGSFREDGRLRMVTQQPDCQLEGSILNFNEKIYSYDSTNNIQDYLVTISFSVSFTDLTKNAILYENKSLTLSEIYAVSEESTSRFKTRDDAINEICNKLFKTVMQNTLESW